MNNHDQEREAFALIPVERSYDMRAAAILHYNTARKGGADLDDALEAAWRATLAKAHSPDHDRAQQPARVAVPESWYEQIHNTLRSYRLVTLLDGNSEGSGYPLIDALTADGQPVSGGIEECQYLADAIWNTLVATPAQTTENGTTGDKYRAELYDEVWQKARGMGYGNVTDALSELEHIKAQHKPIAIKTHGAWDGLDGLDALLDGTAIYAGPAPEAQQLACTCPSGDGSLRHPCPRHGAQDVSGLVEALHSMACAYKSAITAGYERITALGGNCDSVQYMLNNYPDYKKALDIVAAHRDQQGENQ